MPPHYLHRSREVGFCQRFNQLRMIIRPATKIARPLKQRDYQGRARHQTGDNFGDDRIGANLRQFDMEAARKVDRRGPISSLQGRFLIRNYPL